MKANELMIDDLVYCHQPECKGHRIDYIHEADEEVGADGEIYSINDIDPIPLTPEILEKNGFTRYGQVYANLQQWVGKFGDKRKSLVQDIRTGEWGMNDVWIDYVHELQHVLKLCGIEKTIELCNETC